MRHIKTAAKGWNCKTCKGPIEKGTKHFCELGITLPYGRYIGTMVVARFHLFCAQDSSVCCKEGEEQLRAARQDSCR